ncbi:uncharacterized protein LOC122293816 [Carya illinoinensis]|uniref:uncharacterized protein LOC122293816 n=1 Tax=Carya illinoinensis TaxID=32201 RepID=UPI001C729026|nr:uncharacterized protein LOC122293816 [Carya illinoinensis]
MSYDVAMRNEDRGSYEELYNAVRDGNLEETRRILESQPEALNKSITDEDETALHIAVINGREDIVQELVNQMSEEALEMHDSDGYTALITAAVLGNETMVECMLVDQHRRLISITDSEENLPVVMALNSRQIKMGRLLFFKYHDHHIADSDEEISKNATLLTRAIYTETLDIALELIKRCPRLALTHDESGESPILALASMRHFFPSGNQLGFWKQYIYSWLPVPSVPPTGDIPSNVQSNQEDQNNRSGLPVPLVPPTGDIPLNVQSNQEDQNNRSGLPVPLVPPTGDIHLNVQSNQEDQNNRSGLSVPSVPPTGDTPLNVQSNQEDRNNRSGMRVPSAIPTSDHIHLNVSNGQQCQRNQEDQNNRSVLSAMFGVLNFSVIKQLSEMKEIHDQSHALLSQMCEAISKSTTQELKDGLVYTAITRAAKNGIFEFVSKMLEMDRRFLWTNDRNRRNIFMLAVLHRQEKIFSILYRQDRKMNYLLTSKRDVYGNNILHMAGMIEDSTWVNKIPGAALQMQRELQWFKDVERIVHPKDKESTNEDGLTPRQLFTKNHADLMENGQKWMKVTATSCTVVGALIVTIMFAVAFTIPGGNDQTTGFPIFLKKKLFVLFIICDTLSLFSSSTSILMFLGILTSSYAEDDFLEYLPRQMIIGLSTLFCSIATMVIAFSTALIIMLHDQYSWILIPIISLACVPVIIFIWMQFPLLKIMIFSTYGSGIFNRKKKM